MIPIYTAKSLKEWDEFTIQNEPIASLDLMERAAVNCVKFLIGNVPFKSISIFCGTGNNGGDGLAIARLLAEKYTEISVNIITGNGVNSPNFEANLKRLPATIKKQISYDSKDFDYEKDLLLDCMIGSGLNRPIQSPFSEVITRINNAKKRVVSIDLPSGLFIGSNRDNSLENCIKADLTLTIQAPKLPFLFADYYAFVGKFKVIDIQLSAAYRGDAFAYYLTKEDVKIKARPTYTHKGMQGRLIIVGGRGSMVGAGIIAAKAAFYSGCGYVIVHSSPTLLTPLMNHLAEAIWEDEKEEIKNEANAFVIGPGLGQDAIALEKLKAVLKLHKPTVIDADALNLLAANRYLLDAIHPACILTPHLKEFERLVGTATSDEQRLSLQQEFATKYTCSILRKGPYSAMVMSDGSTFFNSTGNSAMATAGMGDALSGIIGSLLAQGYSPKEALLFGTYIHGASGDKYARDQGEVGLTAGKLIDLLPAVINSLIQD